MSFIIGKIKDDHLVELSVKSMQRHFACFQNFNTSHIF